MAKKKLTKEWKGSVLEISIVGVEEVVKVDSGKYDAAMKDQFLKHGISQKLGDAAAGKDGKDAFEAIKKVVDETLQGKWTIRIPAGPKVSKKELTDGISKLSAKEQEAAKTLLTKLGITI